MRQKVVVYAVSGGRLLVFRHVDFSYEEVGIQVPSGSVRPGESIEAAALRELQEETGHVSFEIVSALGMAFYDQTPYRTEVHERHFFAARPMAPMPERWRSHEEHDGEQPPTRLECFWLPLERAHLLQSGQSVFLWKLSEMQDALERRGA